MRRRDRVGSCSLPPGQDAVTISSKACCATLSLEGLWPRRRRYSVSSRLVVAQLPARPAAFTLDEDRSCAQAGAMPAAQRVGAEAPGQSCVLLKRCRSRRRFQRLLTVVPVGIDETRLPSVSYTS